MNLAGFIAKRIAFTREKSFSRFIIRLATAATVLSVTVMIVAMAITNGFQYTISQKIFSFWGHIRVQHFEAGKIASAEETAIEKNDTVAQILQANPDCSRLTALLPKTPFLKPMKPLKAFCLKAWKKITVSASCSNFLNKGAGYIFPIAVTAMK